MVMSVNDRKFSREVLEASTPVLVYFWAPWCGICRVIPPALRRFKEEWGASVNIVGINADQNLKLANTYRLRTLPTLLVFEGGKVRHRIEEFHSLEDIHRQLEALGLDYAPTLSNSLVTVTEMSEARIM